MFIQLETNEEAYEWARRQQGFTGTLADWVSMSAAERAEYEAGARGEGTT